ncbi:MAG: hypothetical protein II612_03375 [Prevotella sp.]|nr:hypothetical protein [Prevotella sp.]
MKRMIQTKMLHRMLCTLLLLCAGVTAAMAGATASDYYFKVTATPSPTAGGKVYVGKESTNNPSYVNNGGTSTATGKDHNVNSGSLTFYFYAKANNNYIFDCWRKGSATGEVASRTSSFNETLTSTSESESSPETYKYYAIFKKQTGLIKVMSKDESKGSVQISKSDNVQDDVVTITAIPDASNGVAFLGWKKNNQGGDGVYYSTDNPLTLTADNNTKGTYYAYFSNAAQKVYIRLKNKKTQRFLSFYGTTKAEEHSRTFGEGSNQQTKQDGFIFNNSLKMISNTDAQGNPTTVFLRTGNPNGTGVTINADIQASNTQYTSLAGNNYKLTFEKKGKYYRVYTTFTFDDAGSTVKIPSYLCDIGSDFAVMKSEISDDGEADWEIYSLDENTTEGAFGANTKEKFTKDGMYYTTMYTDFPYKLLDGVNAYYLVYNEEFTEITDRVVFTQVKANNGVTIVPAYTAVILECQKVQNDINSTSTVTNRLLPLLPNAEGTGQIVNEGANFLKGYISVNGSTVANNKKRMYVLSANKEGVLGFHPYSKDNMTPNKAYLLAPEATDEQIAEYAKKVTFSFGEVEEEDEGTVTKIQMSEEVVNEADGDIYDLLGRKVENPGRGIYIKNNKKFVVK